MKDIYKIQSSKIVNYDFNSNEYSRKFYDSYILKSCHTTHLLSEFGDIKFYILTQFWDKISVFKFKNITDLVANNSLSIFPEVRQIHIKKLKEGHYKCQFEPMYGDFKIEFNFAKVTIVQKKLKKPIVRSSLK